MGTLFNQPERQHKTIQKDNIESFIQEAQEIANKYKISVPDVINAAKVLELERKNDLYISNGDIFNEQIAGIGTPLQQLISVIEKN